MLMVKRRLILIICILIIALGVGFLRPGKWLSQYPGLIVSVVFIGLIFTMSSPYFKILADESNLIGTSLSMHPNKTAWLPYQGLQLN